MTDINEYLPHPFIFSEKYNTLSGLILYHNQKPKLNEKINADDYEITVKKIQRRTVRTVLLKEISKSEELKILNIAVNGGKHV